MRGTKISIALAMTLIMGGLILTTSVLSGKPAYSKKEKKPCIACHVKAGSKDLNDVGKCYAKNNHSLEGCESK
jgi:hypothetical protein